jgi:hypothetical protein
MNIQFYIYFIILLISSLLIYVANGTYKEQIEETYDNVYTLIVLTMSFYFSLIYLLPQLSNIVPNIDNSLLNLQNNYLLGVMMISLFFVSVASKINNWDIDAKLAISYILSIYYLVVSVSDIKDYLYDVVEFTVDTTGSSIVLYLIALIIIYQNVSASQHLKKNRY